MYEHTASGEAPSKIVWENVEQFARLKIQEWFQDLLEEEVNALLGRAKSQRRGPEPSETAGEGAPTYRNGSGGRRL